MAPQRVYYQALYKQRQAERKQIEEYRKKVLEEEIPKGTAYDELGIRLGITRERVRQLAKRYHLVTWAGHRPHPNRRTTEQRAYQEMLPVFQAFLDDRRARGVPIEALGARCFQVAEHTGRLYCADQLFRTDKEGPGYYRLISERNAWAHNNAWDVRVLLCGDGRRFCFPTTPGAPAPTRYIPLLHDGPYGAYREAWPAWLDGPAGPGIGVSSAAPAVSGGGVTAFIEQRFSGVH
jgi:hypothetical protein